MHDLPQNPLPTFTGPAHGASLPKRVALYTTLAFSISAASTALSADYENLVNLKPATITETGSTNTVILEQYVAVVPAKISWLESTIFELMSDMTPDIIANTPDKFIADIDKHM
jgi:hypothetical protein